MHKNYALQAGKIVETSEDDAPVALFHNLDDAEKRYLIDTLKIDPIVIGLGFGMRF
jgi:hypothetical protein